MKKIYIKPITEPVSLWLADNINNTSWRVDGEKGGNVIEGNPEDDIDAKGSYWNGWDD